MIKKYLTLLGLCLPSVSCWAADIPVQAKAAMKRAATFFHSKVASHGGYVYFYSLDLEDRWGEGRATPDQIWIQPPGTPTVGLAFLEAHRATGDSFYLKAATDAAMAVAYGQLRSGGWTNCVDFDRRGKRSAAYRNGKGRGKNNSSLDDGQTQSALLLLIRADQAHQFKHKAIHEAARVGLDALLKAQFPNGGFPQVWTGPVAARAVLKARFPEHDWRTEGRIKNYWDMYTLNDNVCGYVAETLTAAHQVYREKRYMQALRKLGDFLVLAQLPDPQPAWAQQYNERMEPIWARRFEPAAVAGDESQEVIETLLHIARVTGDPKYLAPIPRALAYLKKSQLADGRLARYYELKTNKPLYMMRRGKNYTLTYDDSNLPAHYGWKSAARLDLLERQYREQREGRKLSATNVSLESVRKILTDLDAQGRWVSIYEGQPLVGQAKMALFSEYLSSELFSRHLTDLSHYLLQTSAK